MSTKVFLGFDFGKRHIGVAVGQAITQTARPLTTLRANNGEPNWQDILDLIQTWQPHALVVGVPLNMDGTTQAITADAEHFIQQLAEKTQLTVHSVDERLTTVEAKQFIFTQKGYKGLNKASIDAMAAKHILESWLQSTHEPPNQTDR
jgi:putative Holliday junction resolvase